jgi:hypothetical protein
VTWTKKLKEYKGKNYHYSLREKLKREKRITDEFESVLSSLTLEEIIGLKLELASSYINNRLYGIPIWSSTYYVCREACLKYALSACRSMKDAASLLGINESDFRKEIKRFDIKLD